MRVIEKIILEPTSISTGTVPCCGEHACSEFASGKPEAAITDPALLHRGSKDNISHGTCGVSIF